MEDELRAVGSTLTSLYTFHQWQNDTLLAPKVSKYASFSAKEKTLLDWYPAVIRDLGQCIQMNQSFLQNLALSGAQDWGLSTNPAEWAPCSERELQKAGQTLTQLAREWSSEGASERSASFQLLLDKICSLFPVEVRNTTKVLVPGCGTGRLLYELVKAGFCTQGNEVSLHMLIASGHMLNHSAVAHSETIFPFIGSSSHRRRRIHQFRPVSVPDESPMATFSDPAYAEVPGLMSMTSGSFTELYGPSGPNSSAEARDGGDSEFLECKDFDAVVTCFFLDTASNIIDYIESIHHCLNERGVWMNFGPLNWHFEGSDTGLGGMELARDELFELLEKLGFEVIEHQYPISTAYAADSLASGRFVNDCDFWVAKKKPNPSA